jgi:hypothetical protein
MFELSRFSKQIVDIMAAAIALASAFSYTLIHHIHNPFDPCATGFTIELGTFLIADDAHEATQNAINSTILKLRTFGFMNFSTGIRDMDEWTRELVTISSFDGEQGVLSRFVVEKGLTWVCGREDVSGEQPENTDVVRLPPSDTGPKIKTNGEKACSPHYSAFKEERVVNWTQSRMPHRRWMDEGASHNVSNESHRQDTKSAMRRRQENAQEQQNANQADRIKETDGERYEDNVQGKQ